MSPMAPPPAIALRALRSSNACGQGRVGVAIEINEPAHRVIAGWRQPWRCPSQNRRGSARHQRCDWSDGKGLFRIDASSCRQASKRTVKPAGIGRARADEPALQYILPVEVRSFAIRRRDRVDDCCLSSFVEAVQVRHGRIECKERVERQRRGCSVDRKRVVAAQALPIRVAHGGNSGKTIKCSAKHDHQKPRIPRLRPAPRGAGRPRRTALPIRAEVRGGWIGWIMTSPALEFGRHQKERQGLRPAFRATQSLFGFV